MPRGLIAYNVVSDRARAHACALAVLAGLALALTLPRPGVCALGWIGLAPLLLAVSRRPAREAFALGWLGGAAFHALAFYWVYSTCRFAKVPVPVALLAWAALAAFQGLAWGLFALIGKHAAEPLPSALRALGWALAWTAVAFACERWTPRLPGDLLEYTQWRHLTWIQIASLLGPHGLGLIVVWVNAALADAWERRERATPGLALAVASMIAALVYGGYALAARPTTTDSARVEILQPDIDQYQKWDEGFSRQIETTFEELLHEPAARPPALIIWPESALPYLVKEGTTPRLAQNIHSAQIVGAVTEDPRGMYNTALYIAADGRVGGVYHKRELVPFGEYVPFPFLRRYVSVLNELGGITGGPSDQALFATPLGAAAVTVCYEAVFPRWSRFDVTRGARLIVNITNDGWYKDTWGPYQHFNTNVYRAVENRVTVIRSGNTGVSGVISPWGEVLARTQLGARGRLDADVPLDRTFPNGSLYARRGDILGWSALALTALMLLLAPGLDRRAA